MLKKIFEKVRSKKLVVYNLRRYLKKLYEGYPTHYFYGYEKVEKIEEGMKNLIDDGIIKDEEFNGGYQQGTSLHGAITLTPLIKRQYRLTAEGLKLVESWGVEKLTKWVIGLTIGLFIIGLSQLILTYLQNPIFKITP